MGEFNAAQALREIEQRSEQIGSGEKIVPVMTAVIAVLAALATLFTHHGSISGLAEKNEAILYQSKASDQYNYYESKRIKVQLDQALIDAGVARSGTAGRASMDSRMVQENSQAKSTLRKAQLLEAQSEEHMEGAERYMTSYENYQVAATLFEVSIVLVSITALMRTKVLLLVGGGATLVGLGFFAAGVIR